MAKLNGAILDYSAIQQKLAVQIESFQEGFEILSKAHTLKSMAKQFSHILMGNFLTTDIRLFKKDNLEDEWTILFSKVDKNNSLLKEISKISFEKILITNKDDKVSALYSLADGTSLFVFIGKKLTSEKYSDFDILIIQIFLVLFDNAYQTFLIRNKEKELIFSLNNKVLQLHSLIDTGIEISKLQNRDSLLKLSLERAATLTNASKAMLVMKSKNKIVKRLKFPSNNISVSDIETAEYKIKNSFKFQNHCYEFILADKEIRRGVSSFDATDDLLLDAFARQVSSALENEQLHKTAIERENIKKELAVAASIQQRIIPDDLPKIEGYDIAGINIPSKEVGGDYYNVFSLKNGKYALIIADVTGKGVPAALLVSTLDAALGAYLDTELPLSDMAQKLNKLIYKASTVDKFITFFIAVLEPASGEIDILNAGHNPSLFLSKRGTLDKINAGGVAFGMFDMGLPFESEKRIIKRGERLLLFTDGIPEAMNNKSEEFSDEKLEKFFIKNKPARSETFIRNIVKDVKKYAGSAQQSDDITALYLIRK